MAQPDREHVTAARAVVPGHGTIELGAAGGQIAVDSTRAPYVRAQLTVPMIDPVLAELLDARDHVRIEIDLTRYDVTPLSRVVQSTRSFDLSLVERVINHESRTIELDAQSDECLLVGYRLAQTTPDLTAIAHQGSLRGILNNAVLAKIGAALEPGTDDTPFRVLLDGKNLMTNPTGGATQAYAGYTTNATATGGIAGVAAQIPGVEHQGKVIRATQPATANSGFYYTGNVNANATVVPGNCPKVTPETTYTVSVWVRPNVAKTVYLGVETYTAGGVRIGGIAGTHVAVPANTWTQLVHTFTAPATAANATIYSYSPTAWAAGNTYEFGALMFTENRGTPGIDYLAYYDGNAADTADYGYAWAGTVNASESTRTALIDRAPELLAWQPGVSAAEFIQPLLTAAGLRLYSDGHRFYLIGPTHTVPGRLTLTDDQNVTAARDTVSLADATGWHDAVVIRYRWRDSTGEQREQFDVAGTGTHVLQITYERPYPGPGAAAYVLGRLQGQGRVQAVTALTDYSAEPAQDVSISLPTTIDQTGQVSGVVFDLTARVMHVTSRGLTDTPPTAWVALAPGVSWADSAIGDDWTEE